MEKEFVNELVIVIKSFLEDLKRHLPALEREVNHLIKSKESNTNTVGRCLDTLLSLTMHGVGDELFSKLLAYYEIPKSRSKTAYKLVFNFYSILISV